MGNSTPFHLAKENDVLAGFLNLNMEVFNSRIDALQLVKFMIVSCKDGLCFCIFVVVEVFYNCPGYWHTVKGACSSSNLIQKNKASLREVVKYGGTLQHLNHKGRFTLWNVIWCTNSCEDLIYNSNACTLCRNKGAALSQKNNERSLTQQCRFTCHVWTGKYYNLLRLIG